MSREQIDRARAAANATRSRAAELHWQLDRGEITLDQCITESAFRNYRLRQVLGWQRRWGPDRVARAMAIICYRGSGGNPTCGELTERQIAVLLRLVQLPPRDWSQLSPQHPPPE